MPENEHSFDDLTCDCRGSKGWKGETVVPVDGINWPLDFAARHLECSEKDLRDLVRIAELEPAGTMQMASFRRSGRHPRVYAASKLIKLYYGMRELAQTL